MYVCSDAVLLDEINNKLEGVINEFRSRLPTADGLVVRPIHAEKVKQAERHQRAKIAQKYSSLPPYKKRGKKKMNSLYRNRVGKRANELRKVSTMSHQLNFTKLIYSIATFTGSKKTLLKQKDKSRRIDAKK